MVPIEYPKPLNTTERIHVSSLGFRRAVQQSSHRIVLLRCIRHPRTNIVEKSTHSYGWEQKTFWNTIFKVGLQHTLPLH